MNYKKKYLKYKLKYLNAKKLYGGMEDGGIEDGGMEDGSEIYIFLSINCEDEPIQTFVNLEDNIGDSISQVINKDKQIDYVLLGNNTAVDIDLSFNDYGIDTAARLNVFISDKRPKNIRKIVDDIIKLNYDEDEDLDTIEKIKEIFYRFKGDKPEDLHILNDLYLQDLKIKKLPESFGYLKIINNLYLNNNELTSLPESFGNLVIGGSLYLQHNKLNSLPESFSKITKITDDKKVFWVDRGGRLDNKLTDLWLHNNQLTSLPESFSNIRVRYKIKLSNNKLKLLKLPKSFFTIEAKVIELFGHPIRDKLQLISEHLRLTKFDHVKEIYFKPLTLEEKREIGRRNDDPYHAVYEQDRKFTRRNRGEIKANQMRRLGNLPDPAHRYEEEEPT